MTQINLFLGNDCRTSYYFHILQQFERSCSLFKNVLHLCMFLSKYFLQVKVFFLISKSFYHCHCSLILISNENHLKWELSHAAGNNSGSSLNFSFLNRLQQSMMLSKNTCIQFCKFNTISIEHAIIFLCLHLAVFYF